MDDDNRGASTPSTGASAAGGSTSRRPLVIAAVLAALVVVAGIVVWQRRSDPGPRVLVIGDSLVSLVKPALEEELDARGWRPTIVGLNGRTIAQVHEETASERDKQWSAVVIWAGHNDAQLIRSWGPEQQQLLDWAAGQRCVAIVEVKEGYEVDVVEPPPPRRGNVARDENQRFHAFARTHRQVTIVPWAATAEERGAEIMAPDGLHTNPEGQKLSSSRITQALERCPDAPD